MDWLRRWMYLVGGFYVLMGLFNTPWIIEARLPTQYPDLGVAVESNAARALVDVWFMFGAEVLVIGVVLIAFAPRHGERMALVWAVLGMEVIRGIAVDVWFLTRGYDPPIYVGWIVVHLIIILTGLYAIRRVRGQQLSEDQVLAVEPSLRDA
jgi:hypothetical protein